MEIEIKTIDLDLIGNKLILSSSLNNGTILGTFSHSMTSTTAERFIVNLKWSV